MNALPFLLGAAALFWGWQTDNWLAALAAAVLLEAPRYARKRWALAPAQFNRVADSCTLLFLVVAGYLYFSFGNPRAIVLLFQWLPLIVAPLALAQRWSTTPAIDLSVLFWSLRRRPLRRAISIDFGFPLYALWLLAASAANRPGEQFYVGLCLLSAWPLWLARPRSFTPLLAVGMLAGAALAGYGGQLELHRLQLWLEGAASDWISGGARTDPYRSTTDIGAIGELKLSGRILLRVTADPALKPPLLLHRASYDDYVGATWVARNGRFAPLAPDDDATSWSLERKGQATWWVAVQEDAVDNPVLTLPANTARIAGLAASELKSNALGAVQAARRPGFVSYRALGGSSGAAYGAPTPQDLRVPRAEAEVIAATATSLQLAALPPERALAALRGYFEHGFSYSTSQGRPAATGTALGNFLQKTRAGHCEYFATATVLLARAAGIPARYATGFSAQEWSEFEAAYMVRERHAHAWARVWIDGAWRDIDTTPPGWFAAEAAAAPFWVPLADLWSWLRFALAERSNRGDAGYGILAWLALPLLLWLAWRSLRGARAAQLPGALADTPAWPGQDSEFYLVEQRLAELGHARRTQEPPGEWLARIAMAPGLEIAGMRRLLQLHLRHRFDPPGLAASERASLREEASAWLARHPAKD